MTTPSAASAAPLVPHHLIWHCGFGSAYPAPPNPALPTRHLATRHPDVAPRHPAVPPGTRHPARNRPGMQHHPGRQVPPGGRQTPTELQPTEVSPPTAQPASHHDRHAHDSGGLPQDQQPQDDRRCYFSPQGFSENGMLLPPSPCRSCPAGGVEIPCVAGDLGAVWIVHPFGAGVKRGPMIFPVGRQRRLGRALGPGQQGSMGGVVRSSLPCSDPAQRPTGNPTPCLTQPTERNATQ